VMAIADDRMPCLICGTAPKTFRCWRCSVQAELVDCIHQPQPRPITKGKLSQDGSMLDDNHFFCLECGEWPISSR